MILSCTKHSANQISEKDVNQDRAYKRGYFEFNERHLLDKIEVGELQWNER